MEFPSVPDLFCEFNEKASKFCVSLLGGESIVPVAFFLRLLQCDLFPHPWLRFIDGVVRLSVYHHVETLVRSMVLPTTYRMYINFLRVK